MSVLAVVVNRYNVYCAHGWSSRLSALEHTGVLSSVYPVCSPGTAERGTRDTRDTEWLAGWLDVWVDGRMFTITLKHLQ